MLANLRTLKKDFLAEKKGLLLGSLALIVCDALQLIVPNIVGRAIDDLSVGKISHWRLVLYGSCIVLLALGTAVMRYFWRYFLMGPCFRIEEKLRNRLFGHLQELSANYYSFTKTGDLMAHATNDILAVRTAAGWGFILLIDIVFQGTASLVMMLVMNSRLTLYALIPLVAVTVIVWRFDRALRAGFLRLQESFSDLTEKARENFAGVRVVKAYAQEAAEEEKFGTASLDYFKKHMRYVLLSSPFGSLISLCAGSSTALVLLLGGRDVILTCFTIGSFVAFVFYLGYLTYPMTAVGMIVNLLQRGEVSMGRINKLLATPPEIADAEDAVERTISGGVEFRNLTYRYPGAARAALENISLRIPPGRTLAITGRIGSGKSTLVNLIPRLLEPRDGEVFIDGIDVRKIGLKSLRSQVACVPQDTFLFSDTIRENIAFGRPDATEADIQESAKLARVHDQIMSFPNGYASIHGERGITLSGGEKQRAAIARALVTNPRILILDDSLSSVDTDTEEQILGGLRRIARQRTSIIISHRISTVSGADEIVVLDDGKMAERGTHGELLAQDGIYADIFRRQQIEAEIEKESFGTTS